VVEGLVAAPDLVSLLCRDARHLLVRPQPGAQLHHAGARPAVHRQRHALGDREVRRDLAQRPPLGRGLEDEPDLTLLEVAQAAVDQLGRAARGARGEISALDECGAQSAHRSIARDAGAGDATADHEHLDLGARHLGEVALPGLE